MAAYGTSQLDIKQYASFCTTDAEDIAAHRIAFELCFITWKIASKM